MSKRWMIPMIDFVFLSLGGLLALLTQMEVIESVPLDLASGDAAAAMESIESQKDTVTITTTGIALNGGTITRDALATAITQEVVLVRIDSGVAAGEFLPVLTAVHASGERDVRLQFESGGSGATP
ncbi:MAG: hypothetical protein AAGI17_07175 [Planctomycetota bacterium]